MTTAFLGTAVDIAFPQWTDPFTQVLEQPSTGEITSTTDADFMAPVAQSVLASTVYKHSALMRGATLVIPYRLPASGYFAHDTHGLAL